MTDLTPERRAELRTDAENRRLFRFVTGTASDGYPASGYEPIDEDLLALLDAADERDRLRTWQARVAFACQSYVDLVDERDRLAAQVEAVLKFATAERNKISRTYIEQPDTAYAGYANAMDDVIRTIEAALRGIAEDANHQPYERRGEGR